MNIGNHYTIHADMKNGVTTGLTLTVDSLNGFTHSTAELNAMYAIPNRISEVLPNGKWRVISCHAGETVFSFVGKDKNV